MAEADKRNAVTISKHTTEITMEKTNESDIHIHLASESASIDELLKKATLTYKEIK